ncbi:MAG: hypothetical protein AAF443_05780 [Chlamydiota bacterium]
MASTPAATVTLTNTTPRGELLTATYSPNSGMNLTSYTCGGVEVIDPNTSSLFDERNAGLGALIGPHFHENPVAPLDFDHSIFPHVDTVLANGRKDPFSHGIARYVPWAHHHSDTQIQAKLCGYHTYHNTPLTTFEGQDFSMTYNARLLNTGLFIRYSITSALPSLIGLHYYYALYNEPAIVSGEVDPVYREGDEWKPLPEKYLKTRTTHLYLPAEGAIDYGLIPRKRDEKERDYRILLSTPTYDLHIEFATASLSEFSYQLYRPQESSYICIEPLSARQPRRPTLTTSTLEVKLQIFPK